MQGHVRLNYFQSRGSRAVFQFYPENDQQVELIISQAMKAGFTGGLVVDYPNSSKVVHLVLKVLNIVIHFHIPSEQFMEGIEFCSVFLDLLINLILISFEKSLRQRKFTWF